MNFEHILLILLAIVAFVCGVALMFACCKASNGHAQNHHHHHHHHHETVLHLNRTLKSPDNSPGLVVDFSFHGFLEGVECVICLSEFADGDTAKILPNCDHWFHGECIDTWFQSQSTCPICRSYIGSQPRLSVASNVSGETVVNIPVIVP